MIMDYIREIKNRRLSDDFVYFLFFEDELVKQDIVLEELLAEVNHAILFRGVSVYDFRLFYYDDKTFLEVSIQ